MPTLKVLQSGTFHEPEGLNPTLLLPLALLSSQFTSGFILHTNLLFTTCSAPNSKQKQWVHIVKHLLESKKQLKGE